MHSYTNIQESVVMPKVTIGQRCKINKAIIDRSCNIRDGMNIGIDHEQDKARGFRVTDRGLVLVLRGMLGQLEGFG